MSTHNIQFQYTGTDKKVSLNICFLELSEECPRDSNTSSNHPWLTSNPCLSH